MQKMQQLEVAVKFQLFGIPERFKMGIGNVIKSHKDNERNNYI